MAQAEAGKGGVGGEHDITEPTGAISRVVDVLPVGLEGGRAGGVVAIQVEVQNFQHLLVHSGLKLPGKEGGSGDLLEQERQGGYRGLGVSESRAGEGPPSTAQRLASGAFPAAPVAPRALKGEPQIL